MLMPSILAPGDTVGLVAPSFSANREKTLSGRNVLESWGLKVELGKNVFNSFGKFAGTDSERFADLQNALDDPKLKAIFCIRGGYGLNRILDQLDLTGFEKKPKWIIGFSDITSLHIRLQKSGIASIHGPMAVHLADRKNAVEVNELRTILLGDQTRISRPISKLVPDIRPFQTISGNLVGGNLTLVLNSLGTNSEIETEDHILFLEETGEKVYRIDRMFNQLARSGKLGKLKAVVLGQFTDCEQDDFPYSVSESLENITENKIPLFSGLISGHGQPNLPIILGIQAELSHQFGHWAFHQKWEIQT